MHGMTNSAVTPTSRKDDALWLTDDVDACRLLARDPAAFLIGWILDQQVTVQKAFRGPYDLRERLGSIEPATLAATPLAELERVFGEKPALHRFPKAMAARVQQAMQIVVDRYGGDAGAMWWEAADYDDLAARIKEIPGLGAGKLVGIASMLDQRCGLELDGWRQQVPEWGTLGDVDSPEALAEYQARKREFKRAAKARQASGAAAAASRT